MKGDRELAASRRQKALDLRCAGAGYRAIGRELGTSHVQAFRDVQQSLAEIAVLTRAKAEHLRDLELQRCDKMTMALWPKVREGNVQAIRSMVAVMDRRAKLLGLDAPTQLDVAGTLDIRAVYAQAAESLAEKLAALPVIDVTPQLAQLAAPETGGNGNGNGHGGNGHGHV